MHPILFNVPLPGGSLLEVSTYRAAYVIAAVMTVLITWSLATRAGLAARRTMGVIVLTAAALPIGARLWHVATNLSVYTAQPERIWSLQATGHALFGGVAAASLTGYLASRAARIDPWKLADCAAPGLAAGIALMRIGCFANGCCFGTLTNGPTGVTFPPGSYAHLWELTHSYIKLFDAPLPVHPTQLYELVGVLLCGVLAAVLMRTRVAPGVPFLVFIASFAAVRWANWSFRVHPDTLALPDWAYPAIYAGTIAGTLLLVALRARARRPADSPREGDVPTVEDPHDAGAGC